MKILMRLMNNMSQHYNASDMVDLKLMVFHNENQKSVIRDIWFNLTHSYFEIEGREHTVIKIIKSPQAFSKYYIKMQRKGEFNRIFESDENENKDDDNKL